MTLLRTHRPIQGRRPEADYFQPTAVYRNVTHGFSFSPVGSNLEVRTVAALNEIAFYERITRAVLVEEILVAYVRDRFPDRCIPTREEAKYEDHGPDDDDGGGEPLAEGARHFEHDELHWRRGEKQAVAR